MVPGLPSGNNNMMEQNKTDQANSRDPVTRILCGVIVILLLGIGVLVLTIAVRQLGALNRATVNTAEADPSADFDGTISINPPQAMPDFTLLDQHGDLKRLSDLRGQYILLTFGYTHCPDVCPLTLNEFRRIQDALGNLKDRVAFVFVSVDGERDTPQVIQNYFAIRQLDGIIGLTGDESSLRALGKEYGLSFEKTAESAVNGYLVNHTAGSFLLDQEGRWLMRYQFGVLPSAIAADLKSLLAT